MSPYSQSWKGLQASKRATNIAKYVMVAIAASSLTWSAQALANQIAPPEDLSVEKCEPIKENNDILPRWWWKCTDVEGNVAFRPNIEKPQ